MKTMLVMLTETILQTTRHVPRLAGLALLALLAHTPAARGAETVIFTTVGTNEWVVPTNVISVNVELWGGGGAAGSAKSLASGATQARSGGGAGGNYVKKSGVVVVAGTTNKVIVGAGGVPVTDVASHNYADLVQTGGDSIFMDFDLITEYARGSGGVGGNNALKTANTTVNATGGVGSIGIWTGDSFFLGGNGGNAGNVVGGGTGAGGGGGGAGDAQKGTNGLAITAGGGGLVGGGNGGTGRGAAGVASATIPTAPGGGGGGVIAQTSNTVFFGQSGAVGQVRLTLFTASATDHFGVLASSPQTAGVPFDVTIIAWANAGETTTNTAEINLVIMTSPGGNLLEFDWNSDGIYGDNSGTLTNGVATIKARDYRAEPVTIEATAGVVVTTTPASVTIDPAAFAKLLLLAPNETAVPGTTNAIGKTGTPTPQNYGVAFDVTVNAVDGYWNLVSSVGDTVGITAPNDPAAVIPAAAPLTGGQGTINLTLNTIGTNTLTATDQTPGNGTQSPSSTVVRVLGFPIVWQGDGIANLWNTSALNWSNATGTLVAFIPGVFAGFDDTSTNPVVDIVGTVVPGSITLNSTNDFTLTSTSGGSIGGPTNFPANSLTKLGSGTLTIASSNFYTGGTTISGNNFGATNEFGFPTNLAGALRVTASRALGSGTVTIGANTGNPGRLELVGGITLSNNMTLHAKSLNDVGTNVNQSPFPVPGIRSTSGNSSLPGTITIATGGNYYHIQSDSGLLTLGTPSATALSYNSTGVTGNRAVTLRGAGDGLVAGNITSSGAVTGQLIKDDAGTWTLSGSANTYSGDTTIMAGTLKLGTNNVIPNGSGKGNVTNNGTLDLNGFGETINGLSGSGIVEGGPGTNLFQVGNNNVTSTFDGVIQKTSGTLTLAKIDTNTLTLSGVHTFSGVVRVAGGTLALTNSASFNNVTTFEVVTSATLDVSGLTNDPGTFTLGASQTLQRTGSPVGPITVTGNLTAASGSSIRLALNTANLPNTNDSLAVSGTFTAGGTLSVSNIGPALVVSNSFQLFSTAVSGFAAINLATNDATGNIYSWTNRIGIDGSVQVLTVTPPVTVDPNPTNIVFSASPGNLTLSWPASHTGWSLQAQTNSRGVGLGTNWTTLGYETTNSVTLPVNPADPTVFYRLFYVAP